MCFRGCIYENYGGECCKRKNIVCPYELEDYEDDIEDEDDE